MKPTLFAKAIGALVLGATALVAHAVPVLMFDNSTYVDTTTSPSGSADALQAALAVNNAVTTFTSIDATSISTALQGQQVLVIPEQQNGALAPDLSTEALDVIRSFVSNGGGLIVSADYQNFLNTLFGYNLQFALSNDISVLSASATGTAFAGGPTTITPNDTTGGFTVASLPAGANSIYNDATTDPTAPLSTVTLFQFGSGEIVQLGYDFNNAAPLGTQDGGWLAVLNNAVAEVSGTSPVPGNGGGGGGGNPGGGNSVPEPGSLALMAVAFGACAAARRRRS